MVKYMKPNNIDHIAIAVANIDDATKLYNQLLNAEPQHIEEVVDQKVMTAFYPIGDSSVELLAPTSDESPIAKFIAKNGTGMHHIAFKVSDIEKTLKELKDRGFRLIDETPRQGAGGKKIAFVHPKSTGGVLIEVCE